MKEKIILLILSLLLLSSCKLTEQKAKRQLVNVEAEYSYLFASHCDRLYPVRERVEIETEYIKGDVITRIDTHYVDCSDTANKGKSVAIQCVSTHRVDTSKIVEKIELESSAKIEVCRQELEAENQKCKALEIAYEKKLAVLNADKDRLQSELKKYKKIERTVYWLGGSCVAFWLLFKLKGGWMKIIVNFFKSIF